MDTTLVSELGIPTQPLFIPMDIRVLDGCSIGRVTHTSFPINLRELGNHSESMQFLPIESPRAPVVLGFSWLQRHNPLIDWDTGSILGWRPFRHAYCLKSAMPALGRLPVDLGEALNISAVPRNTWTSGSLSARPVPPRFLRISRMTTPSTFFQALHRLRGGFIPCQVRRPRRWRRILRTFWLQGASILLPPPLKQGSSLWRRRTKPCIRVLTTGPE